MVPSTIRAPRISTSNGSQTRMVMTVVGPFCDISTGCPLSEANRIRCAQWEAVRVLTLAEVSACGNRDMFQPLSSRESDMNDEAIIEQAIERIRAEFGDDLLGLIVGGSRLRSEGDPQSDLDVVIVIARPQRKRWNFVIEDVEVETFINPPFQMRRYFEEERIDGRALAAHVDEQVVCGWRRGQLEDDVHRAFQNLRHSRCR